jgi:hypothetical protein
MSRREVDGARPGLCPVVGFEISGVEPSGTVSKDSVRSWGDGSCRSEVAGASPGSCLVVCFVIGRVEPSGTVSKDSVRSWGGGSCRSEVDCVDRRWIVSIGGGWS